MPASEQQALLAPSLPAHPTPPGPGLRYRPSIRRFLTSKAGHYSILLLVSLDVSCIFADFLLSLYVCEHTCRQGGGGPGKGEGNDVRRVEEAQQALGIVSLAFSCLFMVELGASVWAFGKGFFRSKFHIFDAVVIVAGFVVDVCLKGLLEEVGSIVVVLRLWRVFKIIEEMSAGAADQMEEMEGRMGGLERENGELRRELTELKKRSTGVS